MLSIREGQCGLCVHFGEHHAQASELVRIRKEERAPEDFVDSCGHPQHAGLHLQVTAISGCDGFEPVNGQARAQ